MAVEAKVETRDDALGMIMSLFDSGYYPKAARQAREWQEKFLKFHAGNIIKAL